MKQAENLLDNADSLKTYLADHFGPQSSEIASQINNLAFAQLEQCIKKMLAEIEKNNPLPVSRDIAELINFWEEQSRADQLCAADKFKSKIGQILFNFQIHLQDHKGINFLRLDGEPIRDTESIDGLTKRMESFYSYLSNSGDQKQVALLMKKVSKYFNLLCATDDVEKIKESLKEFPPLDLACLEGSDVRVDTAIRLLIFSPEAAPFINAYERSLDWAIFLVQKEVYAGNHIHIKPFLEFCLGFVAQEKISDAKFEYPKGQVDPKKLLDAAGQFFNKLQEFYLDQCISNDAFFVIIDSFVQYQQLQSQLQNLSPNQLEIKARIQSELNSIIDSIAMFGMNVAEFMDYDLKTQSTVIDWKNLTQKLFEIKIQKINHFQNFAVTNFHLAPASATSDVVMLDSGELSDGSAASDLSTGIEESAVSAIKSMQNNAKQIADILKINQFNDQQLVALNKLWVANYLPINPDNTLLFIRTIYEIAKNLVSQNDLKSGKYLQEVRQFFDRVLDAIPEQNILQKTRVEQIIQSINSENLKALFAVAHYEGLIAYPPVECGIVDKKFVAADEQKQLIISLAIELGLPKATTKLFNLKNANDENICGINAVLNPNQDSPLHMAARLKNGSKLFKQLILLGGDINQKNSSGETPLMVAIENQNFQLAREIIESGDVDFAAVDNSGNCLAHYAAFCEDEDLIKTLIDQVADLNQKNETGGTPLMAAVNHSNQHFVKILLEKPGVDLNIADINNFNPLSSALFNGNDWIFYELLQYGADINQEILLGDNKTTILNLIIKNQRAGLVTFLIKNQQPLNLDLNCPDSANQDRPIHVACKLGNLDIIKQLIAENVDCNSPNRSGKTPLYYALDYANKDYEQGFEVLSELLAYNDQSSNPDARYVDINQENTQLLEDQNHLFYKTALEYACSLDNPDLVELLLTNGACVYSCLEEYEEHNYIIKESLSNVVSSAVKELLLGTEHLLRSMFYDDKELFLESIKDGAVVNACYEEGETALEQAIKINNVWFVKMLIQNGATFDQFFDEENNLTEDFSDDVVGLLMTNKYLFSAVESRDMEDVQRLLQNDFLIIDAVNQNQETVLEIAITQSSEDVADQEIADNLAIVKMLIDAGFNIDVYNQNLDCSDAVKQLIENSQNLLLAVKDQDVSSLQTLIDNGARVNARDKDGYSALFFAIQSGDENKVRFLLEKGADIKATNKAGETVLHFAVASEASESMLNLLIASGVDLEVKDNLDKTALQLAQNYLPPKQIAIDIIQRAVSEKRASEENEEPQAKFARYDPKRNLSDEESESQASPQSKRLRPESSPHSPRSDQSESESERSQ